MSPRRSVASAIWRVFAFLPCAVTAFSLAQAQGRPDPPNRIWNDPRTIELVDRAVARRTAQLADTGLVDYRATAHGYVTFLAQIGEGYPDPPQVVRADELAVEVYWRAPNQSKQRVVGRRDTLMLPTDIAYHRDHLAIVQNNFPAVIRLGDGDEVRDVPHPLSAGGREAYDFVATDSLAIRVGSRSWNVVQVDVRPRDEGQPRAVGSFFLDRETAWVVRMSISFTRSALRDPALEDVSVVLDNGLVDGRFWLPRRQEIEIRRSGSWLDFPARGIIRGEWDLCCIEANRGVPVELFVGPEITVADPQVLAAYPFPGRITDSLPARLTAAMDEGGARRVQEQAATLVRAEALARASGAKLSARRISDFVRVNRVEGLAIGGGATVHVGAATALRGELRYGFDDRQFKHAVSVAHTWRLMRLTFRAFDELRAAGDAAESSLLGNSIGAQELGVDLSDEFRAAGAGLALDGGSRVRWRLDVERSRESSVVTHATPYSGRYRPALVAAANSGTQFGLSSAVGRAAGPFGTTVGFAALVSLRLLDLADAADGAGNPGTTLAGGPMAPAFVRARLTANAERPLASGMLAVNLIAASTFGSNVPEQARVMLGGPVTAPGYDVHALRGMSGASARAEWRVRAGSFPLSLGRFGTTRVPIVAAPLAQVAVITGENPTGPRARWARSVGLGLISFHDLIRLDITRGIDASGRWAVQLDFGRLFWPIL